MKTSQSLEPAEMALQARELAAFTRQTASMASRLCLGALRPAEKHVRAEKFGRVSVDLPSCRLVVQVRGTQKMKTRTIEPAASMAML